MNLRERLVHALGQRMTPQTAAFAPMVQMMVMRMSEAEARVMLLDFRTLLNTLLEEP